MKAYEGWASGRRFMASVVETFEPGTFSWQFRGRWWNFSYDI